MPEAKAGSFHVLAEDSLNLSAFLPLLTIEAALEVEQVKIFLNDINREFLKIFVDCLDALRRFLPRV